jgi:hypothetical protein
LVPNREQRENLNASKAAYVHLGLTARMPLTCAKSLRIQLHARKSDESEKLDRQTQFETGLTSTPYATNREEISVYYLMKSDIYDNPPVAAASQSNPTDQSDQIIGQYIAEKAIHFSGFKHSNLIGGLRVQF